MSSSMDKLAKNLYKIINNKQNKKPKQYDTTAVVSRVTEDAMWVRFPGNDFDTPVANTTTAAPGDTVQVRVGNGRAIAIGNTTAPSTDDTTANQANDTAEDAKLQAARAKAAADAADEQAQKAFEAADKAEQDAAKAFEAANKAEEDASKASIAASRAEENANIAKTYAEEAKTTTDEINDYAETAGKTVTQILNDGETAGSAAQEAKRDAEDAKNAADYATYSLSLLEDIVGTLNWISQHGVYVVSTDTTVVPNKTYYTLAGTAITSPTGNPSENAYYELAGNVYVLSSDTVVDTSKTYYQVTATAVIDPTGDPSTNPYYELQIDEAITQYINTHLSLTDSGLRVTDGSQASVLINSTDGVSIWNGNKQLAKYGEGAVIGDEKDYHIEIVNNRLSFKNGNNEEIAYMTNNELYIPRVVVVDSMQIGAWIWDAISTEYHLTLKWKGVN